MIRCFLVSLFVFLPCLAALCGADAAVWSVTHETLPGKVYLVGSVHAGKASMYPLDEVYDRILSEADFLAFEIADPEKSQLEAVMFASRRGSYPASPEDDLFTALGEKDFQKLSGILGVPGPQLRRLKPWVVIGALELKLAQKHGIVPEYGLERIFHCHAGVRQKISLENTRMQLKILSSAKLEPEMLKSLSETVNDPASAEENILACVALVEKGDLEPLVREAEKDRRKYPLMYKALFTDRNQKMANQILNMMRNKRTGLVIVGAAHFIGEDSVADLMRKEGCSVVRLPLTGKKGKLEMTSSPK